MVITFHVNISKGDSMDRENSHKLKCDWQMDNQTVKQKDREAIANGMQTKCLAITLALFGQQDPMFKIE